MEGNIQQAGGRKLVETGGRWLTGGYRQVTVVEQLWRVVMNRCGGRVLAADK